LGALRLVNQRLCCCLSELNYVFRLLEKARMLPRKIFMRCLYPRKSHKRHPHVGAFGKCGEVVRFSVNITILGTNHISLLFSIAVFDFISTFKSLRFANNGSLKCQLIQSNRICNTGYSLVFHPRLHCKSILGEAVLRSAFEIVS